MCADLLCLPFACLAPSCSDVGPLIVGYSEGSRVFTVTWIHLEARSRAVRFRVILLAFRWSLQRFQRPRFSVLSAAPTEYLLCPVRKAPWQGVFTFFT